MTTRTPRYHATTDYALPAPIRDLRPLERRCPGCGIQIGRKATRCKSCAQLLLGKVKRNRAKFAARAERLTTADIAALTAAQMDRARDLLMEWREVGR